jgi:hypothetical protein
VNAEDGSRFLLISLRLGERAEDRFPLAVIQIERSRRSCAWGDFGE